MCVCVCARIFGINAQSNAPTHSHIPPRRDRHTRRQTTSAVLPQLLPTAQSDWLRQADSWTDVPEEAHMGG